MKDTISKMATALTDSVTASVSAPGHGYSINNVSDTITLTGGGYSTYANTAGTNNVAVNGPLGPFTLGGTYSIGAAGTNANPWLNTTVSPKIKLDGEGADIEVNGWSLIESIKKIEERLNILTPNTKLEEEWEELKALGDQYRKLEQHIKDKQATWDKLKAMPPVID